MAESLRIRFGNLVEAFGCLWVATYFYRSDRGVDSESARSRFAMTYVLTGPNCENVGAPSQQEIKAARVRLGSTHSYRRIRPASESADWPIGREASGRLCHLMKRGAFPGWQKLFVLACPFQVGTKSFLPSTPWNYGARVAGRSPRTQEGRPPLLIGRQKLSVPTALPPPRFLVFWNALC